MLPAMTGFALLGLVVAAAMLWVLYNDIWCGR